MGSATQHCAIMPVTQKGQRGIWASPIRYHEGLILQPQNLAITADDGKLAQLTVPAEGRAKLTEAGFFEALAPSAEFL